MTPSVANKRILMVEDDVYNMRPTIDALEVAGAKITIARSATEALSELKKGQFDLVILDIMMASGPMIKTEDQGRSTGIILYSTIRESIGESLPVVVSTVVSDPQALEVFRSDHHCSVLLKPYLFGELVSAIEAVLSR